MLYPVLYLIMQNNILVEYLNNPNKLERHTHLYYSGTIKREEFYVNDKLHFDYKVFEHIRERILPPGGVDYSSNVLAINNNIAVIHYDEQGNAIQYENWVNGVQQPVLHQEINDYNILVKKWYELNGVLHYEHGPAYIEYYNLEDDVDSDSDHEDDWYTFDKFIVKAMWKQNGKYYRKDNDFTELICNVKKLQATRYWYNPEGKLHREDGPALVTYKMRKCSFGRMQIYDTILTQEYWLNGIFTYTKQM